LETKRKKEGGEREREKISQFTCVKYNLKHFITKNKTVYKNCL